MSGESDSDSESRPHKRQRLSSPTYDEQFEMYSQDEVNAFDMFERRMSQAPADKQEFSSQPEETTGSGLLATVALKDASTLNLRGGEFIMLSTIFC